MSIEHRVIENMKNAVDFYKKNVHKAIKRQEVDVIVFLIKDFATVFKSFLEGNMPNDRIVDVKTNQGGDVDVTTERSHSMRLRISYVRHAYEEIWHEIEAAHLKEKVAALTK